VAGDQRALFSDFILGPCGRERGRSVRLDNADIYKKREGSGQGVHAMNLYKKVTYSRGDKILTGCACGKYSLFYLDFHSVSLISRSQSLVSGVFLCHSLVGLMLL